MPAVERGPQEQGTTATLNIPECISVSLFLDFVRDWEGWERRITAVTHHELA